MSRFAISLLVLAISVISLGRPADAQVTFPQDPVYSRLGWYVGLGGSYAVQDFEISKLDGLTVTDSDFDDSWGINGRVGYRFDKYFAGEVAITYYDTFDGDVTIPPTGKEDADFDAFSVMINGKIYPWHDRYQPYALFGLGLFDVTIESKGIVDETGNDSLLALQFGAGIDIYATENWLFNFEAAYVYPTNSCLASCDNSGRDYEYWNLGLGFQYRF